MASDPTPAHPTTSSVLMIRPAAFRANRETRASNAFQASDEGADLPSLERCARAELDAFARALRDAGVDVHVLDDTPTPVKSDAVFPNNWISFHAGGEVVLYPLEAPSRRAEVRADVVDELERTLGCRWPRRIDLTGLVADGAFLEGTGSLVLDRPRGIAYACRSSRTTARGLGAFRRALGFDVHAFDATDEAGVAIYHTNVLFALGPRFAVVCLDALPATDERRALERRLQDGGHEIIAITRDELCSFCGNVLALESRDGEPLIALSERARLGFEPAHRERLEAHGRLVSADLTTIETYGGGSARCMLAEIFRPTSRAPAEA